MYPTPTTAVDLALITVIDGALHCVLTNRSDAAEVDGEWALPGGFVHMDVSLTDTAKKVLNKKVGIEETYLEQLATYGAIERDPRQRVISIVFFALLPADKLVERVAAKDDLVLAKLSTSWKDLTGGVATAETSLNADLDLAFDHAKILGDVIKRLRGKLNYTGIGFELLPKYFTLREAQEIHEAILGHSLTKPAFRRKLLDRKVIKPTGKRETASAFRPAELYTKIK